MGSGTHILYLVYDKYYKVTLGSPFKMTAIQARVNSYQFTFRFRTLLCVHGTTLYVICLFSILYR